MDQATHSRDYRTVDWFGASYQFSPPQAACIQVLWRAWLSGTPIIREEQVLETARVKSRSLKEVFKTPPGHAAWGSLIADGDRRGTVRLIEPAAERAPGAAAAEPSSTAIPS
ncbi:MAG TPA: hypothetical protein VGN42_11940 [Pirellulales bacterium]|nr:hypothetical protein [Pirellulales bacterium]